MDERVSKALEFSNFLETQNNQKRIYFSQYNEDLIYYINGNKITVTQQLISFCQSLMALNQTESWLIDDNNIPFIVTDIEQFTYDVLNVYANASAKYGKAYDTIKKSRSVEGLLDL